VLGCIQIKPRVRHSRWRGQEGKKPPFHSRNSSGGLAIFATRDEARRIAAYVAKLLGLLRKPRDQQKLGMI
jgi:hypothetical protein